MSNAVDKEIEYLKEQNNIDMILDRYSRVSTFGDRIAAENRHLKDTFKYLDTRCVEEARDAFRNGMYGLIKIVPVNFHGEP